MSSSRHVSDGRRPGKAQGKAPERSSFGHTCNLLSQYIKEKGSLKDFNLEIGGKIESLESLMKYGSTHATSASSTMKLLTDKDKSTVPLKEQQPSMDFFPQLACPESPINILEDASNKESTSKQAASVEPKRTQLTIFYAGKVLVFDDCPADKAKELVQFASKGTSHISTGILSSTLQEKPNPGIAAASASSPRDGLPPRPNSQKTSGILSNTCVEKPGSEPISLQIACGISSNTCKDKANHGSGAVISSHREEEHPSPLPETNGSDLPIARRSSLHRFLEKRKDRAAARGPYQVQERPPSSSSSKGDEQLELKL